MNTQVDAVIIAGGRGTRSANPDLPKILQEIKPGFTLLDQHMQNMLALRPAKVIFALSFGSENIIRELSEKYFDKCPFEIEWNVENEPLGTASAVLSVKKQVVSEDILIILGDTAIETDYLHFYLLWTSSNTKIGLFVFYFGILQ